KAFPQLQYLPFNGRGYSLNRPKSLALQILSCFDALMFSSSKFITLHVNRFCAYHRSQSYTTREVLLTLLTEHIRSKGNHYSSSKIVIGEDEDIIIWR
ncbi:unnamed protein product, partial [Adineta ricciae]